MTDRLIFALTLIAVLGTGLVAGTFFAFSTFVMKALAARPPAEGIAAMQAINVKVINPWFLGTFTGTALLCGLGVIVSLTRWSQPGAVYLLIGCLVYIIGSFVQTFVFHIPRNNALDALDPSGVDSADRWAWFVSTWTAWNHVRTVASAAASLLLVASLVAA
ncbi:MAG: DUF1772 domain-containing protein [Pseudonocardiaceae bacterium]|nr:DUF1772 domain-containing protein [Pseudonocardiaceae bacterium]